MLQNYQRPAFAEPDYFDERGKVIAYGSRWDAGEPPADSYSETAYPQRFGPVHLVANALLEWLDDRFDVRCLDDPALAKELRIDPANVVRSVRILPANSQSAPIGMVFTDFPGVCLSLGSLFQSNFPVCGCDAYDDSVSEILEEMESVIGAVTTGAFIEHLDIKANRLIHRFEVEELGFRESSGGTDSFSSELLAKAANQLPPRGAWAPWPVR